MSGREIARRLEVSPRSVRRYIAMLQAMGIPIEGERGRYGQYHLRAGFKLPPLMFDNQEALALTLGLLLLRRTGGLVEPVVSEGALAKLHRVLPESLRQQVTALQATLVLDTLPVDRSEIGDQLALLSLGTQNQQRLHMVYLGKKDEKTERLFDPYGVVQRAGRWYTTGYCHLRQEVRIFRLDRIESVKLCDDSFEAPEAFDAYSYINEGIAMIPSAHSAEILLETSLEKAQREIYPNLVTLEPHAKGVLMCCTTDEDMNWLARLLSGLSFSWKVLKPVELEYAIKAHTETLLARLSSQKDKS